jgi:hypothetical protein
VRGSGTESDSFKELPLDQDRFKLICDEFLLNERIDGQNWALVLSDATGIDGEISDKVLQGIKILPFRAHLEGRTSTNNFNDIRDCPYFSIAAPHKDLSGSLREMRKTNLQKRKNL